MRTRSSGMMWWPVVAAVWLLLPTGGRAELRFLQPTVHVGVIRSGMPLTHRFVFVNDGAQDLEITEARASCGCLAPRLEKRQFRPGEEGAVMVDINTLSQPAGPHSWTVFVKARSGDAAWEMPLLLGADLVTEVTVQPAFLAIYTDRAATQDFVLTDHRPKAMNVVSVRASSPRLRPRVYDCRRDGPDKTITQIRMSVAEDYPDGRHEEAVFIDTDDPSYRELKLQVIIIKRSRQRVQAAPHQVALTAAPGQPIPSRIVLIRDGDDQGVVVEKVVADDAAVVCTWAQGPNKMATLRVRVDRDRLHGESLESAVHVYVSKPQPDVLTIPVRFTSP